MPARNPRPKKTAQPAAKNTTAADKTLTIKCSQGTLTLADDLGQMLGLTRTDVVKLGIRLVQRHLDGLLEQSQPVSELMTRFVVDLKKFDSTLDRHSAGGRSEMAALWRDFDAIQRLEDAQFRNDALDTLKEKLALLIARAKKERKPLLPLETDLNLA